MTYVGLQPISIGSRREWKLRAMSHCKAPGAIVVKRSQLRLVRGALGRVLPAVGMVATACIFAAACAPQSDSSPLGDQKVAADAPSPSPGRTYAEAACASCHAVIAGQTRSPNPKAPTFDMIANLPGMTLMALNAVLHTSHETMPNLIIESGRIEDLSAYLHTLKR
jgi:hypothetical protein